MSVAVILPTIKGREHYYRMTYDAYCQTLVGQSFQIITIEDAPNWPTACNWGIEALDAYKPPLDTRVHFGADDLIPHQGWYDPAWEANLMDEIPAPYVYRGELHDRPVHQWGRSGRYLVCTFERQHADHDGDAPALTTFSRVPTLTWAMCQQIGPWPELDYYADCWLSEAARKHGWESRLYESYAFTHLWAQEGRIKDDARMQAAKDGYEKALAAL